jgi:hypothetical protein
MITRRIRRTALECQHFPTPGSGDPVTITRLPYTQFIDSLDAAGTIIQWFPPDRGAGGSYCQYDFTPAGDLIDGEMGFPGTNPESLAEAPIVESFACNPAETPFENLRTIELIAENTQSYNEEFTPTGRLTITINYDLGEDGGLAFTVPLHLKYAGSSAQFSWDVPPGAIFNFASILTRQADGLRLTLHAVAWPLTA